MLKIRGRSVLIVWAISCIVLSQPDTQPFLAENGNNLLLDSSDYKYFYSQLTDIVGRIFKRGASGPVQNARDQVSAVVYLMNTAILGEAVVQNLTNFGEFATNLMIIQNMPMDADWMSSIDLSGIDMTQLVELQKVVQDGYGKDIPTDLIEKVLKVTEGLDSVDSVAQASRKIEEIAEKYGDEVDLSIYTFSGLQILEFYSSMLQVLSSLKSDEKPLDSLNTGREFIESIRDANANSLKIANNTCADPNGSFGLTCLSSMNDFLKTVPSVGLDVNNIKTAATVVRSLHYASSENFKVTTMLGYLPQMKILRTKLLNVSDLIQVPSQDFSSQKNKFLELISATNDMKGKDAELKSLSQTISLFRPISRVVGGIKNRLKSRKRTSRSNTRIEETFKSFQGLTEGMKSLDSLAKTTGSSSLVPENYKNSKIVERIDLMKEWALQRGEFLKFSKGIGATEYVSTIIKNFESLAGLDLAVDSMEAKFDSTASDYQALTTIGNLSEGIYAIENIEKRIALVDTPVWEKFIKSLAGLKIKFDRAQSDSAFTLLPEVAEFELKVKKALEPMNKSDIPTAEQNVKNMGADFFTGFAALNKLFTTVNGTQSFQYPSDEDIKKISQMIFATNFDVLPQNWKVIDLQSGFKIAYDAKTKIENLVQRKPELVDFSSKTSEIKKLKQVVPNKPDQKDIDALQPMMTELKK